VFQNLVAVNTAYPVRESSSASNNPVHISSLFIFLPTHHQMASCKQSTSTKITTTIEDQSIAKREINLKSVHLINVEIRVKSKEIKGL
jgi:hypothetical protein